MNYAFEYALYIISTILFIRAYNDGNTLKVIALTIMRKDEKIIDCYLTMLLDTVECYIIPLLTTTIILGKNNSNKECIPVTLTWLLLIILFFFSKKSIVTMYLHNKIRLAHICNIIQICVEVVLFHTIYLIIMKYITSF